jgi:hypothetical protein
MTRMEAQARLDSTDEITYDDLHEIFRTFGIRSEPHGNTDVYCHPRYTDCGAFTAREDEVDTITLWQRLFVRRLIICVQLKEQAEPPRLG